MIAKHLLLLLALLATQPLTAQQNLALNRTAWASSSYDYNMTAHLVTDGICDRSLPAVLRVSTPQGPLPRREREWALDGNVWSHHILTGGHTWLQFDWEGQPPVKARRVLLYARMAHRDDASGYGISCQASADGQSWTTIGQVCGDSLPGKALRYKLHADPNKQADDDLLPARTISIDIPFYAQPAAFNHLRLALDMDGAAYWNVYDLRFFDGDHEVWALSSQQFSSMWMSDGGGQQWLCVDLGTAASIDSIVPHWVETPRSWHPVVEDNGQRVRLVMDEPGPSGYYALRELEVFGRREDAPAVHTSRWYLQRASEVQGTGEQISEADYDATGWISATVPGTVLTSYINIGTVPDPNYADQADQISESFFHSNFWYRGIMTCNSQAGGTTLLCFDGINWKANVFFNGHRLGRIEGAFKRAQFDVTPLLHDGDNIVAVEIVCNDHFGSVKEKDAYTTQFNGGILGADNPTFHASIGWDWITTVRGREAGIWNDVYLTAVPQGISLSDPYVKTEIKTAPHPTGKRIIEIAPSVFVRNHNAEAVSGMLHGWIGDVMFEREVVLPANSEQELTFTPNDFPQLRSSDFRLWWPNGYGEPCRYEAGFCFKGDTLNYKAGLRQLIYADADDSLRIYINGRRLVPLGGNWGFAEHNLQYGKREYDAAVGYHRDMHCTMIRNWVGQTGDREFYDACDSMGIMVWQDFWLANPADGPDPYDEPMFLNNAEDYIRRIRQHPSIALYCGRNEGFPPATIDKALRQYVSRLSPGLEYISSSADGGVTGHGPYCAQPARVYFERQSGKIHTERGMPAVMNIESLQRTFEPDSLWPQSTQWGQHDYTLQGAQRAMEFNTLVAQDFGPSADALQFARRAQLINYEGYRAMFESGSKTRSGLLIWMSHPCWPTMVWQTYDYFFDPTGAYFGVKKACEPLHIQLNALTDSVEVVNLFAGRQHGLTATASLYDAVSAKMLWTETATVDSHDDSTAALFPIATTDTAAFATCAAALLRLELHDTGGRLLSQNDYFLPGADGQRHLTAVPSATLIEQHQTVSGNTLTLTLRNTGSTIAPLLRLNLKDADGRQVLPVVYSDNYITLLPGERRTIKIDWSEASCSEPVVETSVCFF